MKNIKIAQKLEDSFLSFRRMMTNQLLDEAKGLGLSLSHFEVVMFLAHTGEANMKDIAKILHITPPSASVLVDTLVEKKLVRRVPSDKDRRTIHVSLSPEAQKLMISVHKKKVTIFKKILSKLNNEDQENLIRILNKLTNTK